MILVINSPSECDATLKFKWKEKPNICLFVQINKTTYSFNSFCRLVSSLSDSFSRYIHYIILTTVFSIDANCANTCRLKRPFRLFSNGGKNREERLEREWFTIGRRSATTMTEVTALIVTSMNRTSGRTDKAEAVIAVAFVSLSFFSTARRCATVSRR